MHRWTAGSERALGPARTPPTRHRAGSAASRLKAGAPSGRCAGETAGISSAGFPSESRFKTLLVGPFIWGHLRDGAGLFHYVDAISARTCPMQLWQVTVDGLPDDFKVHMVQIISSAADRGSYRARLCKYRGP
jgi:hypothetical protein